MIMFVTALYKEYIIWTFCCTGNSIYESLPVVLLDLNVFPLGPKAVLFCFASFLLEALLTGYIWCLGHNKKFVDFLLYVVSVLVIAIGPFINEITLFDCGDIITLIWSR